MVRYLICDMDNRYSTYCEFQPNEVGLANDLCHAMNEATGYRRYAVMKV